MHAVPGPLSMNSEQGQRLSAEIARQRPRLRNFIRKRVANDADVEDILQDVLSELVEAYGLMQPIEHVSAWLFRVARNRVTDFFRGKKTDTLRGQPDTLADEDEVLGVAELLPATVSKPESDYWSRFLLEELDTALNELPEEQQEVFIAHELEGKSFKQLAAETGLNMNTLLARKHYAVRHLRKRLQAIYDQLDDVR